MNKNSVGMALMVLGVAAFMVATVAFVRAVFIQQGFILSLAGAGLAGALLLSVGGALRGHRAFLVGLGAAFAGVGLLSAAVGVYIAWWMHTHAPVGRRSLESGLAIGHLCAGLAFVLGGWYAFRRARGADR